MANLSRNGKSWKIVLSRKKKDCRFGRGWNEFSQDNELTVGQILQFNLIHGHSFEVVVVS